VTHVSDRVCVLGVEVIHVGFLWDCFKGRMATVNISEIRHTRLGPQLGMCNEPHIKTSPF